MQIIVPTSRHLITSHIFKQFFVTVSAPTKSCRKILRNNFRTIGKSQVRIGKSASLIISVLTSTLSERINKSSKMSTMSTQGLQLEFLLVLSNSFDHKYLGLLRHRKKVLKIFENSFLKNGLLEFWSETRFICTFILFY